MKPNTSLTGAASRSCRAEHHCRLQRVGGFTLTELLVVMGVIALVLGVLIPALWLVLEQYKLTACGHNLKQLGMAIQMYADDNGGRYPAVADPNETVQEIQKLLLPYVKNKKIFCCPRSKEPYDFSVTYDPKTTLSNVRLDLLSRPDHILLAGETTAGTHKGGKINVITGTLDVIQITMKEFLEYITRSHS